MKLEKGEHQYYFKAGDEWCYLWTPSSFEPTNPAPVVIHHHGARGYVRNCESDWLDTKSKVDYLRAVSSESGAIISGSHACGDHWGNECSVKANAALLQYLETLEGVDTNRLGFMGGGLYLFDFVSRVRNRHSRHQCFRIWMLRIEK